MSLDKTNMRLAIKINGKVYSDIGIRGNSTLSEKVYISGEYRPRFLEDFIKLYGKKNIKIISYGKLKERRDEIDKLLL